MIQLPKNQTNINKYTTSSNTYSKYILISSMADTTIDSRTQLTVIGRHINNAHRVFLHETLDQLLRIKKKPKVIPSPPTDLQYATRTSSRR